MMADRNSDDIRGGTKADAVFEKLLEDLESYREAKSIEETCKAYAKRNTILN